MTTVVSCNCGAKIKVPESRMGQALRCPRCKADLGGGDDGRIVTSALADPLTKGATCPICQTTVQPGEPMLVCPACDQVHHRDCWTDVGGCATYGCENAPQLDKAAPVETPRSAWGETKKCPACGETIKSIAIRCRFCGTEFETADPLSLKDLRKQIKKGERLQATRTLAIFVFILSILGCLAPVIAIAATAYLIVQREVIAKAGPSYLVMGYSAMGISYLYSVLWLLFFLHAVASR
jgi:uncharacterized paraquat-inducible protein A